MRVSTRVLSAAAFCLVLSVSGLSQMGSVQAHGSVARRGLHLIHTGYLTVGSDTTYPPMESLNTGTHRAVGADVDLANALAKAMGLKGATIVSWAFDSIIPALARGKFDVVMSSMNDTPAREKQIAFVDYMRASEGIVVKKSSSIHANSYRQMCGRTVAVESGTTELDGLNAANRSCKSKISIKTYTLDTAAFEAFASGHAEAYTGDLPVAALYVKQHGSALRLAGKPFGAGEDYGIGLPKSAKGLKSALTTALHKIKANGQYAHILSKWGVGGASL